MASQTRMAIFRLLLVITAFLSTSVPAAATPTIADISQILASVWTNIYVDNTWTGATVGTELAPFTNIQAAVDFANSNYGSWSSVTIMIRDTGNDYLGQVVFPNGNAMRLQGINGRPTIAYSGSAPVNTIQSGTNYMSPGLPPAQIGLEHLRIENRTSATGELFCAQVHTWHSVEPGVTNDPSHLRFGVRDCIFDGRGTHGGIELLDLLQHATVEPYNSNVVANSRFEQCTVGVSLRTQKEAQLFNNWFVSNVVAIRAVDTTNSVYRRAYADIRVFHNVFLWCGQGVVGGVYPRLVYYNNTFYESSGTGLLFNAGVLGPEGPSELHNNIFHRGLAAWSADWGTTNALVVSNNLYYGNVQATGFEAVGGVSYTNAPDFASESPGDPEFLYLSETSPAANLSGLYGGATYLGALPPVPEAGGIGVAVLVAGMAATRRRHAARVHPGANRRIMENAA